MEVVVSHRRTSLWTTGVLLAASAAALKKMGHTVKVLPAWGSIGHMQAIRIDPRTGTMMAGGDPRRTAYAMGY
jgi:gamma-glutamyltranspeptidase